MTADDKTRYIGNRIPSSETADFSQSPGTINMQFGHPRGDQTIATFNPTTGKNYLPGDIIGDNYQLTRLLGKGGMGTVYACKHLVMGQAFAIKILTGGMLDAEGWSRFQSEARALARLNNPGIVSIYNMGVDAGLYPYYVMELLSGDNLESLIHRAGSITVDEGLDLFIQVADALISAHSNGIIHRDVKPSNLMLGVTPKGAVSVKLVDFGIARLSQAGFNQQSQTATGLIFGTPYYMSPEQCDGKKADERSDIYSFGCTFFEALTGAPPFCGNSALETFMLHQNEEIPTLASRAPGKAFPEALELALQKMLAKRPSDRYQTMQQLKHDLERIREGKTIMAGSHTRQSGMTQPLPQRTRNFDDMDVDKPDDMDSERNKSKARAVKITFAATLAVILAIGTWVVGVALKPAQSRIDKAKTYAVTNEALDKGLGNPAKTVGSFLENDDLLADINKHVTNKIVPSEKLAAFGASQEEIAKTSAFNFLSIEDQGHAFDKKVQNYLKKGRWKRVDFQQEAGIMSFPFPEDINVGAIKIDDDKPIMACSNVPASKDSRVVMYFAYQTHKTPEILDCFDPADINGVEGIFDRPLEVINRIKSWPNLDEFSFFNSLTKAMPEKERWDETPIDNKTLPYVEQLKGLKSLGLCGPAVSGQYVAMMPMLNRLTTLKLKRISNVDSLLKELPKHPNIKELWLIAEKTDNKQLELLTHMPNLETLHVRRGALTPDSLEIFKRMPKLKHLMLDKNNWSAADKAKFQKAIPDCQFELVADTTYWDAIPTISHN